MKLIAYLRWVLLTNYMYNFAFYLFINNGILGDPEKIT
jgi:hypothetical protein